MLNRDALTQAGIDVDEALERVMGNEMLLERVLGMYLNDTHFEQLREAVAANDADGAIAAVHSGWRGTSLGIAPKAVAKMTALYGTRPEDVLAAIGPGIGPCCFETHDDVPTALEDRLGPAVRPFCRPLEQAAGKFTVDLKGIIAWELRQAGLAEEHIDTLPLCTACHPELYWSHRKMGDQRGNHAAMIALEG